MKRTGRNLRRRLNGISRLTNRLARARYFRGHGVHSPFVYGLVREAFMTHKLRDGEHTLYDALRRAGIYHRRAVQLQNAFTYCGYQTFSISEGRDHLGAMPSAENEEGNSTFGVDCADAVDMNILTRDFPADRMLATVNRAAETGTTLCVMNPYEGSARGELCRRIVREHPSTTVDNRGYLLVFNNHLPKQHFKL